MRCDRIVESGAYVLGALPPAERTAFEAHLAGCALCRDEVADLAGIPGLLGRLDAAVAESLLGDASRAPAGPEAATSTGATPPSATPPGGRPVAVGPGGEPDAVPPGGEPGAVQGAPGTPWGGGRVPPLERLLAAARRRRAVRRRWSIGLASVGLAVVLALAGVAVLRPAGQTPPVASGTATTAPGTASAPATPRLVAMRPVGEPGPVSAQVGLTAFPGGTRIDMQCEYGGTEYDGRWTFRLYVYGRTGPAELAGSWTADPGADVRAAGTTRWAPADIAKVELRRGDGTPLLVYTP